jgi:bacteriophage N4 adsorption protein B
VEEVITRIAFELTFFAAVGFIIGAVDDFMVDVIWIARTTWRRIVIYTRHARVSAATLTPAQRPGRIAVMVAAWDESSVIADMLLHAQSAWRGTSYQIYVGVYPNDPATLAQVQYVAGHRVQPVVINGNGPTTKADCLNQVWAQICADEEAEEYPFKAIVLHDAEDIVHPAEIAVFDTMIERFDFVQLPVLPFIDPTSRWIAGHYNDEFAEAHCKTIVVREAIGAAIPAAGVGCAFEPGLLRRIATLRGGVPFDADSLTEDYELGLRLRELGATSAFVRVRADHDDVPVVAVRAHFPNTLQAAVQQKARWITGIALAGWDRLGWRGGIAECWMRLHDRRAPMGAIILSAAYLALILSACSGAMAIARGAPLPVMPPRLQDLMTICAFMLLWRMMMRFVAVTHVYGWREGVRAIPRLITGNIIEMMAARRAIALYVRMRRDGVTRWDKTRHHFPKGFSIG